MKNLTERQKRIRRKRQKRRIYFLKRIMVMCIFFFCTLQGLRFLISFLKPHSQESFMSEPQKPISSEKEETKKKIDYNGIWLESLQSMASQDSRITQIINQINLYPENILELLVKNPETFDFVLQYPEQIQLSQVTNEFDISDCYTTGQIPLFLQWDKRWGYYPYGQSGIIALDGCGPTCLSMVVVGLTKDSSWNPAKIAEYSQEQGYIDENQNTSWSLMSQGAKAFHLNVKELPLDENSIIRELENGNPIICSMGPGDFTAAGHFIVLYQYQDEKILLHDPNSLKRSQQTWDFSTLQPQIKNLWSFSAL